MKRLTLFLLCATILVTIYAQDIIVTNNSERINALITEVSETEIRYKKADNPDGPIFVLPTSDISSILYRNGDVQTFAQHDNQAPQETGVMTSTFKSVSASEDLKYIPGQQLRRMHSNCYYYGNLQMNDAVFREFIRNNCSAAYRQYKTGYNLKMTGSITSFLCIGGVGAALLGVAAAEKNYDKSMKFLIPGTVLLATGVASFFTFYYVGKKKQDTAYQTFNSQCANSGRTALSLNIGVANNGLGLSLDF